jgi:hypothetical protein
MNNTMLSKIVLDTCSQVVVCPLSLPDANWPEGLKHLTPKAKFALSNLLQGRNVEIFNFEDAAIQKIGVGEAVIFQLLGFKAPDSPAAFSSLTTKLPYIAIRPVSLHAGRDHVVLKQSDGSYASPEQLSDLANAIKPLFEQYGLALSTPYASDCLPAQRARWFISPIADQGNQFFELATSDSQQALGRNIDAYMASGQSARRWRQLETEIQMTWFDHPVNSALKARGMDELNSIWIDGSISSIPNKPKWIKQLLSQRPSLEELAIFWAIASDTPHYPAAVKGSLRIVDDWQGRLYGDALGWLYAWEGFLLKTVTPMAESLILFAGETSVIVVKPLQNTIQQKMKSLFQSKFQQNPFNRSDVSQAFGL